MTINDRHGPLSLTSFYSLLLRCLNYIFKHLAVFVIRYDRIESLTWTRKLSIQLYLAHVARKIN